MAILSSRTCKRNAKKSKKKKSWVGRFHYKKSIYKTIPGRLNKTHKLDNFEFSKEVNTILNPNLVDFELYKYGTLVGIK